MCVLYLENPSHRHLPLRLQIGNTDLLELLTQVSWHPDRSVVGHWEGRR